jgi:HSP20 family protein
MNTFVRFNSEQEAVSLRDTMNQLFAESFIHPHQFRHGHGHGMGRRRGQVPMDLYETESGYVVSLAVPGLTSENFDITIEQDVLTICGTVEQKQPEQEVRYHVREQNLCDFNRSVRFPTPVEAEKVQASLNAGILTIHVPKAETARARRIDVAAS